MRLFKTKAAKAATRKARQKRFNVSEARKRANSKWQNNNRPYRRAAGKIWYEQHREEILFKSRLGYWLDRIVRAEALKGRQI